MCMCLCLAGDLTKFVLFPTIFFVSGELNIVLSDIIKFYILETLFNKYYKHKHMMKIV